MHAAPVMACTHTPDSLSLSGSGRRRRARRRAGDELLLASGSQDRSIRVWAIRPAGADLPAGGDQDDDFARSIARCSPPRQSARERACPVQSERCSDSGLAR